MKKLKPNTVIHTEEDGKKYYLDERTGNPRKRWWTKARIPGRIRKTRLPGGSGFRNNWEGALPMLLLACFLSSCLWAVPCMAKGDSHDGLRVQGVSGDPCGGTAFASRLSGDSVRCFTSMGPLTFLFSPHPIGKQRPIPFLIDYSWYLSKAPLTKYPEKFSQQLKPLAAKQELSASYYAIPVAIVLGALLLTWVSLRDWEAPFEDDKETLV